MPKNKLKNQQAAELPESGQPGVESRSQQIEETADPANAANPAVPAQNREAGPVPEGVVPADSAPPPGPPTRDLAACAPLVAGAGIKWQHPGHVPFLLPESIWGEDGKPNEAAAVKALAKLAEDSPYLVVQRDTLRLERLVETSGYAWQSLADVIALVADRITYDDHGQPEAGSVERELTALAQRSPYLVAKPSEPSQGPANTDSGVGSRRKHYGRPGLDEQALRRRFPALFD